ncbi:delta-like protein D [Oscarella lobularis]|uniref:delta-like protein D n=1 Tax=Oscarella lobularis TaxID=121494 RepID=UPI003313D528
MLVVAVILLLSSFFHTARGDGTLEIQFNQYRHSASKDFKGLCCDSFLSWGCSNDCDNFVIVCYRDYNPSNDNTCIGTRTTGKFDDSVTFSTGKNALKNNLDNPFSFGFSGAWKNSFSLKLTIWDDDSINKDDLVDVLRPGIAHAGVSSAWSSLTIKGKYSKTLSLKWRVQCDANYYGDCSVLCVPQDSDATGHYTCDRTTGQRKCMSGWTGAPQCKTPICKTGCSKLHGSCTKPGQCTCDPGWKGNTCSDCVKKSGCKHGDCSNGNDCICQSHWLGPLCDQSGLGCNDHPCQNGGTCSVKPNSFRCACPSDFIGSTCNVDMNQCRSNPCLNGATCDNHANGFTCNCPSGYAGQFCSTDIDECSSDPCLNNGHCSDFVNSFSCTCQSGYTGDLCDTDIDECADLNDCGVNTVCNNTSGGYLCSCKPGYTNAGDGHPCSLIQCSHLDYLPSSTKVSFSNDGRWVGTTAQITCQDGYSMQPTSPIILSCLENGVWDKEVEKNVCSDIDECEQEESPCGSGEVCHNTVGSHSCETAEPTQTSEPKATEGCLGDCVGDSASSTDEKNSSNLSLYIGVAAGFVLLIIIIIVLLVFLRRRSKQGSIIIVPPPATQNNNSSSMAMSMSMSACQVAVDEEHVAAKMKNIDDEPFYDVIGDGSRSAMPLPPPSSSSSHAYEDMSGTAWRYRAPNPGYGSTIPYTNNASGGEHAGAETDTGAGAAPPAAATENGGAVSLANPTYDAAPSGANGGPAASQDDYLEPVKGGGGRYTKCA